MKNFLAILFLSCSSLTASAGLTVFAATSTTEVMKELAAAYRENCKEEIHFNFASSGSLARQIEAGEPADLFVSANTNWMNWLEDREQIDQATRFNLAGNSLVMIVPANAEVLPDGSIPGRMAIGDLDSTPAGAYTMELVERMGWREALDPAPLTGSNVQAVLRYVERGEAASGIVYASDALTSDKVRIVATFPDEFHSPIVYPVAACSENEAARDFLAFLKTVAAREIIKQHGFKNPDKPSGAIGENPRL